MPRVALLSASYTAQSRIANAQRCINLYPEANPPDSPAPTTFYGTPGLLLRYTIGGSGSVRCLYRASTGALFGVRGSKLHRYNSGSWTELATLATSSGVVVAADNGISAVFVDGTTTAPTVNLSSYATGAMSGAGWYGADFVAYTDSFFVFNKPNSQTYYKTGALDLTLDALDFASAEALPDKLISLLVDHREIWLFGEASTEVHGNTGAADFPFERIGGAVMPMGCVAKHSPARIDNSVVWLGRNENGEGMVWRAQGHNPVRISTHAIEAEWRGYSRIDDAQSYVYQQSGHEFYVLTFPTANKTWVWDAATQLWHERAYRNSGNELGRHRSSCHVLYERMSLVGDFENGNVYELDPETYSDNGDVIKRIKTFQHMVADGRRQFFQRFELDMEVGVGNADDADPQVSVTWSDDGARTWSSTLNRSLGAVGEYGKRVVFNRLGSGRNRVFEVSTTAKAKVALQGAFVDATAGAS
jgi:hypothetical protein